MKHKYLIAVLFFISTLSATAQTPGGVDKPMVWSHDSASVRVSAGAGLTYIGVSNVYGERNRQYGLLEAEDLLPVYRQPSVLLTLVTVLL